MLSLVRDIGSVDLFNLAMAEAGYEPWGEYPIAGRRFFTRGGDQQGTHNVHVFEAGNPEVAPSRLPKVDGFADETARNFPCGPQRGLVIGSLPIFLIEHEMRLAASICCLLRPAVGGPVDRAAHSERSDGR
jgi:GrpB protein